METRYAIDWTACNQMHLSAELQRLRATLSTYADVSATESLTTESRAWPTDLAPPAIDHLVRLFQLSPFERDILLVCAGVEFDAKFLPLLSACHRDPTKAHPTFGLALAALPDAHWSALTPEAPLRRWHLISIAHGTPLTTSPLQIDEQILHYLAGTPYVHERLAHLLEPIACAHQLSSTHAAVASAAQASWQATQGPLPLIQLVGPHIEDRRAVAVRACAEMGYEVAAIAANMLPTQSSEVEELARLCARESGLRGLVVLIESDLIESADATRMASVSRFIDRVHGPILLSDREPRFAGNRSVRTLDVATLSSVEQSAQWRSGFGDRVSSLNGSIERIVSQFRLSAATIQEISADTTLATERLWDECRIRSRVKLGGLARRIEPAAGWDDLIVPPTQEAALRELTAHVRHRTTVYEEWGFADRTKRGLGITALFAGASGTGKTTAAEVLAGELGLDLYCIDLSAVMSKYIGETEANLRRVFDAAEQSGAVLQFDEADALFGKRAEVKDSHDRYANIEVSYLLQRMEEYRGLAILTTNIKSALDTAFLRRLRFIVQFPFPDEAERERIWRRMFPPAAPTEGLNFAALAKLPLAGGNIRSVALGAAFIAADASEPVRMRHLSLATRTEYAKLERSVTELEKLQWE
jgi:DNA polymerase III delta prime subunit